MPKPKVLVTVPNTGWIHKHVYFALSALERDSKCDVTVMLPTHRPFENNLHHIIVDFLKGDWDYWLTFDDDNPPTRNPLDLIEYNVDIIGCPTPVYHNTNKEGERFWYFNAYDYVPEKKAYKEHLPQSGLQKVDAIGTGCILFKRRVFEHPDLQKGAFTRKLNPDGTVNKGNDISFCERAREAGFDIYTHYDYPCRHFNEVELQEMIIGVNTLYGND